MCRTSHLPGAISVGGDVSSPLIWMPKVRNGRISSRTAVFLLRPVARLVEVLEQVRVVGVVDVPDVHGPLAEVRPRCLSPSPEPASSAVVRGRLRGLRGRCGGVVRRPVGRLRRRRGFVVRGVVGGRGRWRGLVAGCFLGGRAPPLWGSSVVTACCGRGAQGRASSRAGSSPDPAARGQHERQREEHSRHGSPLQHAVPLVSRRVAVAMTIHGGRHILYRERSSGQWGGSDEGRRGLRGRRVGASQFAVRCATGGGGGPGGTRTHARRIKSPLLCH